jgi:hypothetical protein
MGKSDTNNNHKLYLQTYKLDPSNRKDHMLQS